MIVLEKLIIGSNFTISNKTLDNRTIKVTGKPISIGYNDIEISYEENKTNVEIKCVPLEVNYLELNTINQEEKFTDANITSLLGLATKVKLLSGPQDITDEIEFNTAILLGIFTCTATYKQTVLDGTYKFLIEVRGVLLTKDIEFYIFIKNK